MGTFVFALSGALLGVRHGMDLFGVLVLAFVTAVSGGIMRDVLIGAIPPESVANWHALAIAVVAGLMVFRFSDLLERLRNPVQFFDAAGLGVFAVAGTQKALDHGLTPPMAAVLGMLTGIGGGMVRDVLMARVPVVLRSEIYAVAALAGAGVVVAGNLAGLPPAATTLPGAGLCVFLRMMAIYRGWKLPVARAATRDDTP
ncbi:MAG: trimeric intracellular cation channel family protein [Rhodopila sp.]|nr:trimeric intracellular cation channel family protein [Rhodopila sp.]